MHERIKKLRKSLDLTQQEFANRIGSTQNVLANYESGRRNPSASVVNNICKTFNVNEEWLRNGTGPMLIQPDPDDEMKQYLEELTKDDPDGFKKRLVRIMAHLGPDQWGVLRAKAEELAKVPSKPEAPVEQDLAAKVAALERQNRELLERIAAIEEEDAMHGLGGGVAGNNVG